MNEQTFIKHNSWDEFESGLHGAEDTHIFRKGEKVTWGGNEYVVESDLSSRTDRPNQNEVILRPVKEPEGGHFVTAPKTEIFY